MVINLTKGFRVVVSKNDNYIRHITSAEKGESGSKTSYSSDFYSGYQFDTLDELKTFIGKNSFISEPVVELEPPVEPVQ
jgi:hypothetical protein